MVKNKFSFLLLSLVFLFFIITLLWILFSPKRYFPQIKKFIDKEKTTLTQSPSKKIFKIQLKPPLKKAKEILITSSQPIPLPFNAEPFRKGYQLGKVIITLEDLEKKFELYYPNTPVARTNLKNWENIASLITKEAIFQNEAIKVGLLSPTDNLLDPKKVLLARQYFEKEGTSYISGEVISIWFYNTNPPSMGIEAAKNKTQAIIESLRKKIVLGEINMKKAGEMIASMEDLREIDFAYKTNAYFNFEFRKPTDPIFNDPELTKKVWQLNNQELSPVLIGKDFSPKGWYEAFFCLIKINAKEIKEFNNPEELVEKRMKEGLKITLEKI